MMAATQQAKKLWTDEELQALKDEGYAHEVVNGELVMSPKNNPYYGDICADLLTALRTYAKAHQLGAVLDGEHLLEGFNFPVADLFKKWDWE
jgi:Uma2 family endonuclease